MTDILSIEMFFPDCPECRGPGWAFTIRANGYNHPDTLWECLDCGPFETPKGSRWDGVDELREPVRDAYIHCAIRGVSYDRFASMCRVSARTAQDHVHEARTQLGLIGTEPTAIDVAEAARGLPAD